MHSNNNIIIINYDTVMYGGLKGGPKLSPMMSTYLKATLNTRRDIKATLYMRGDIKEISTRKTTATRRSEVRETEVSLHNGAQLKAPLKSSPVRQSAIVSRDLRGEEFLIGLKMPMDATRNSPSLVVALFPVRLAAGYMLIKP